MWAGNAHGKGSGSPVTCQPCWAACVRVRGMLVQAWMGMNSRAPALALLTAADSGAELRAHVSTPAAPRKYAALTAAPMFCCARTHATLRSRVGLAVLQGQY